MPMPRELVKLVAIEKYAPNTRHRILQGVSFSVYERECIVVSGKNGSGKTVLMTILAGLEQPSSGTVHVFEIEKHIPKIGLVFQDADTQILGDTVDEDILFGIRHLRLSPRVCEQRLNQVLRMTGLENKRNIPARNLSGGEKRRLAVAGVLMINADIIIFDEPFANLDFGGVVQVVQLIELLKEQGKTLIILTHELEKILALASRLLILHKGSLVFDGDPKTALYDMQLLKSCSIRFPLRSVCSVSDLLWNSYD